MHLCIYISIYMYAAERWGVTRDDSRGGNRGRIRTESTPCRVRKGFVFRCRENSADLRQSRPGSELIGHHCNRGGAKITVKVLSTGSLLVRKGGSADAARSHKGETFHFTGLSSEYGTYKTVKARLWPWLQGTSPCNYLSCCVFARKRT
jgi:hypothetical protein